MRKGFQESWLSASLHSFTFSRYAAIFIELKNAYLTLGDNPTRRQLQP